MGIGSFRLPNASAAADLWYGVEWDYSNPNPECRRIGNLTMHASLPIHNQMKGCLLLDNGTVNYYLKPDDWTKKADGTASNLTGADGQVMVEVPDTWWYFDNYLTWWQNVKVSPVAINGWYFVPRFYVSAYEAAIQRSTSKLASVVNTDADYRGGNNTSAWDGTARTQLGYAVSNLSRPTFRTCARNRGNGYKWNMYGYTQNKVIFWLAVIEFANRNNQANIDNTLTPEGYRKGGLGAGLTTVNSTEWTNFNSYYALCPCGYTNSLGNGSGEMSFTKNDFPSAGLSRTWVVNRYRGIEVPFGSLYKNTDGIIVEVQSVAAGGKTRAYVIDDPQFWNDDSVLNFENRGELARASGYINKMLIGPKGDPLPLEVLGASTTYWCDYGETNIPGSGLALRTLYVGGYAYYGAYCGFGYSYSSSAPSSALAYSGSRLCFLP
jgi:hypothetical protein